MECTRVRLLSELTVLTQWHSTSMFGISHLPVQPLRLEVETRFWVVFFYGDDLDVANTPVSWTNSGVTLTTGSDYTLSDGSYDSATLTRTATLTINTYDISKNGEYFCYGTYNAPGATLSSTVTLSGVGKLLLSITFLHSYTSHKTNCRAKWNRAFLSFSARVIFSGNCFATTIVFSIASYIIYQVIMSSNMIIYSELLMSYNNDSDVALQCRNFGYALVNYFFRNYRLFLNFWVLSKLAPNIILSGHAYNWLRWKFLGWWFALMAWI